MGQAAEGVGMSRAKDYFIARRLRAWNSGKTPQWKPDGVGRVIDRREGYILRDMDRRGKAKKLCNAA